MELQVGHIYRSPILGRYVQVSEIYDTEPGHVLLYVHLLDKDTLEIEDSQYHKYSQEEINAWTKVS